MGIVLAAVRVLFVVGVVVTAVGIIVVAILAVSWSLSSRWKSWLNTLRVTQSAQIGSEFQRTLSFVVLEDLNTN